MSDWKGDGRRFFGLTQVCRQLRHEYLPMYLSSTTFVIRYHDLWDLSERFIEPQRRRGHNAVGNINLDLDPDFRDIDYPTIDILPYLKLSSTAPQFSLRMSCNYDGGVLSTIAEVKDNPQWRASVQSIISRLLLHFDAKTGVELEIEVKLEYAEDWMSIECTTRQLIVASQDWFERVGLEALLEILHFPGVSVQCRCGTHVWLLDTWPYKTVGWPDLAY